MFIDSSKESEAFRRFEHEGWEQISHEYEKYFAVLTSQCVQDTLDAAGVKSGISVLDVCTGPGLLAAAAVERNAQVAGLDFSAQAIGIAQTNVPQVEFEIGDAQSLPYDSNRFDVVVSGFGVIHVPNPALALAEIQRVLKPGGRMAISVWEAPMPGNGFGLIYGAIKSHGDMSVPLPHGPDFFQFSDNEKMRSALTEAGFKNLTVQNVDQTWKPRDASDITKWIMEGSVRARALLGAQKDSDRQAIFQAIEKGITQFDYDDTHYTVPMPAIIGSGENP